MDSAAKLEVGTMGLILRTLIVTHASSIQLHLILSKKCSFRRFGFKLKDFQSSEKRAAGAFTVLVAGMKEAVLDGIRYCMRIGIKCSLFER
jgi:hypothetical protein